MEKVPLLSIAIPTFNRSGFLRESLTRLSTQLAAIGNDVELIVSDNCSTDNTEAVVAEFLHRGVAVRYMKNEVNVGADLNCVACFRNARGKYLWILGDDDFLVEGVVKEIVGVLASREVGLLHLKEKPETSSRVEVPADLGSFLGEVGVYMTFISVNIFRRGVGLDFELSSYKESYLSLLPVFYSAALSGYENLFFRQPVLEVGKDAARNGGYNYFVVFVKNYLDICKEFFVGRLGSRRLYQTEMRNVFEQHICHFTERLLIQRRLGNFSASRGWLILWARYWSKLYFYRQLLRWLWGWLSQRFSQFHGYLRRVAKKLLGRNAP